ncbi:MAG: patatin family protein [Eubacterium sp.]|nr:patatin family protein [Eubacterium sp.]
MDLKKGLVVEGGGMRGIYAAGVIDVLLENDIKVDGVIGVSAGAIHGCCYVSEQIGRSIRYYRKYVGYDKFMSLKNFFKTGNIVDTEFCYNKLPNELDPYDYEKALETDVKFFATCTNLETGEAEYIEISDAKNQMDVLRASASLPYFSQIVEYDGKKFLDGGCSDSVPLKAFQNMGYEKNIVILTREDEYRKSPEKTFFAKLMYKKFPKFVVTLKRRHLVYNETVEYIRNEEKSGKAFVIRPSEKLTIDRLSKDIKEVESVYNQGREDALAKLEQLKMWIE